MKPGAALEVRETLLHLPCYLFLNNPPTLL